MRVSTLAIALAVPFMIGQGNAAYILDTVMWGSTFFSNFNFITTDLNHGYVKYLTQAQAQAAGYLFQGEGAAARISTDTATTLEGTAGSTGRSSVRIESKKTWTHGLYVFNIARAPVPACGSWPAMWMVGADWPNNGEIDILEGISLQTNALYSMHTSSGCSFTKQTQLGTTVGGNCYGGDTNNQGCGITGSSASTYGDGINTADGGDYVVEWTSAFIKIWWYPKSGGIPTDLANGAPDQTKRGTPQAYWLGGTGCNIDSKFKAMQIILNINFCGDWAGNAWASDPVCSKKATTCEMYVAKNPTAFNNVKFQINSIKVYQQSTAKRTVGIEDPSLEWEKSLNNITYVEQEIRDVSEVEQRDVIVEVREAEGEQVQAAHLHRHRHRTDRKL